MKKFLQQCTLVLLLIGLYFASDLYEKGMLLNQALPVPVLGYLFWALLAFAVYDIVLAPTIAFTRMTHVKRDGSVDVISISRMILRQLEKNKREPELREKIRGELQIQNTEELKKLLDNYYDGLDEKAKKTIRSYSWKAALCVVFSRNPMVDAVLMFLAQYRMALELMMQYGFKPSPVFNILCFFWIATNSVLNGIFSQATADNVGEIMGEYLSTSFLEDGLATKFLSKLGSSAVEAMTAATTVYVTDWIVNRKLKGERSSVSVKELFAMRKTARKELLCDLTDDARKKIEKWYKESPDEPDTSESA